MGFVSNRIGIARSDDPELVEQQLGPLAKFDYPIDDSTLIVQQIRDAHPSPDGKRLASGGYDGSVRLVDESERAVRRLTPEWQTHYAVDDYVEYTWHCPTARLYVARPVLKPWAVRRRPTRA